MNDFSEIERKWSGAWKKEELYEPDFQSPRNKFYNLMMFPYPSAEGLHAGNMYAFTGSDIYGRYKRMQGYDVFEPIGLDGFGIHSENYALKIGAHPMEQSKVSQERFYKQLEAIGNGFAWNERLETYDPAYYRWTQWIFIQMYKQGLAYRKKQEVNWCPSCLTVLADEQVENGKCERCGTEVIKKDLEQWFFRITTYTQKLLDNLDTIDWSEKVKIAQRNWIGRSQGATIPFSIKSKELAVFTTRPDTLFGVTYLVLAPEHPWLKEALDDETSGIENKQEIRAYIQAAKKKTNEERIANKEKTGVRIQGIKALHPATQEELPVYVADYVLSGYGTGAIMAVPAHDERDHEFAQTHKLPVKEVIREDMLIDSGKFSGLTSREAIKKIGEKFGTMETRYRLRDWLISRQRYWGAPIPMIFCEACEQAGNGERPDMPGWYTVPQDQLPVQLPYVDDFRPRGTGKSPLASVEAFYKTTCPACKKEAVRETDVSDTFLDSAWYYIGYLQKVSNFQYPITDAKVKNLLKKWLPVDMYVGGAEHSVLHLLYVRFLAMALHEGGYIGFEEPFPKFRAHGLLIKEGVKMSKSKGNVITPDDYIREFGADAFRMYLMFLAPFEYGGDFRDEGILGVERFLKRVWKYTPGSKKNQQENMSILHKTIQKVGHDIESLKLNTAVSALMILFNEIEKNDASDAKTWETFLKLLAPFAPFMTEEIWRERLGHQTSIHKEPWPSADPMYLKDETVTIAVQINGRTRGTIRVPAGAQQDAVAHSAREDRKVSPYLHGADVTKVIFVADKIINFILAK